MSWRIAGFCLMVLIVVSIVLTRITASTGNLWLAVLCGTWLTSVIWALTRRSFSLLFTAIMVAMLIFVIMPATYAQLFGSTTIAGNDYSAGVVRALEIAAFAQCGMLVGAVGARTLWPVPPLVRLLPELSASRLDKAARWSVCGGILAVASLSALGGAGLSNFFVYATSGGYGTFASKTTGYFGYLVALQGLASLALVLLPLRLGSFSTRRWPALLVAALATLVLLGGGQRSRFFVPVFAAGLVWLKTARKPLPSRRLIVVGILIFIIISGVIGATRGTTASRKITQQSVLTASVGSSGDLFLPLAGLTTIVPTEIPYLHGTSYGQFFVFLVPRTLWHGKPKGAISDVTVVMDPGNSGLAFPEFGEMYANFGLPGVIIGSLLLGMLIELLSRRLAQTESVREAVMTAALSAVLIDIFVRGAVAPMLMSFAGLLLATALICRRKSLVLGNARTRLPQSTPESAEGPVVRSKKIDPC